MKEILNELLKINNILDKILKLQFGFEDPKWFSVIGNLEDAFTECLIYVRSKCK